jgi:hypothetical protein
LLARADLPLLKPHPAPPDLPVSTSLEADNARTDAGILHPAEFCLSGRGWMGKRSIEVGIIGREGMTRLAVVP